jgi:cyanate permease
MENPLLIVLLLVAAPIALIWLLLSSATLRRATKIYMIRVGCITLAFGIALAAVYVPPMIKDSYRNHEIERGCWPKCD